MNETSWEEFKQLSKRLDLFFLFEFISHIPKIESDLVHVA